MSLSTRAAGRNKLVLGVDIGTTYSAVSFFVSTSDGKEPAFYEVNRWPGQFISGAKVPSVLYYDYRNQVKLCGADTEDVDSLLKAEENNWRKAEWWKLLLRPEYIAMPNGHSMTPLPPDLTIEDIFHDFFTYIKESVQKFLANSYTSGERLWDELAGRMVVILTTPNGWEGRHQNKMREAAIKAKLLIGDGVRERVRFVSEGEAAIHHTIEGAKSYDWLAVGNTVLVCDAGGGTTDIAIYKITRLYPLELEEISQPQCYVAGGIFVNLAARKFMQGRLQGTKWSNPQSIDYGVSNFERNAKRKFSGSEAYLHVDLGGSQSDEAHGVFRGRLRLTHEEIASFFDPCIKIVLDGLHETVKDLHWAVNKVVLVGGFAESPYVHSRIEVWCKGNGVPVKKPDGPLSKAIAHGALSWHLHSGIRTRIARLHYGAEVHILYDPNDPEMAGHNIYMDAKGDWRVRGAWQEIVRKNTCLNAGDEHSAWFHQDIRTVDDAAVEMELYAYRWSEPPRLLRMPDGKLNDGFIPIGTVQGDLCKYFNAMDYKINTDRGETRYKTLQYEVCLSFDEIEIKAALRWKQRGACMRGDATLVYDL